MKQHYFVVVLAHSLHGRLRRIHVSALLQQTLHGRSIFAHRGVRNIAVCGSKAQSQQEDTRETQSHDVSSFHALLLSAPLHELVQASRTVSDRLLVNVEQVQNTQQ